MNKIRAHNIWLNIVNILVFIIFIFFTFSIWIAVNRTSLVKNYAFFIEFSNAHGIKEGTHVRMRGVNIGYIKNMKIDLNSILVLVHINSTQTLIPRNAIIETNQTGLLNDTIVDIIPLNKILIQNVHNVSVFSDSCHSSSIVCHLDILEGDRGLNYDDLVRAATRISQRFDDPNFFNVFYLFLQNSLELSDDMVNITNDIANMFTLLYKFIFAFLENF